MMQPSVQLKVSFFKGQMLCTEGLIFQDIVLCWLEQQDMEGDRIRNFVPITIAYIVGGTAKFDCDSEITRRK